MKASDAAKKLIEMTGANEITWHQDGSLFTSSVHLEGVPYSVQVFQCGLDAILKVNGGVLNKSFGNTGHEYGLIQMATFSACAHRKFLEGLELLTINDKEAPTNAD